MSKNKSLDYFRKGLEAKLKKNPQAKMEDLGLYVMILGVREVQDAKKRIKGKIN